MNPALDRIWIDAARRLDIEVERTDECFLSWDTRRLWVANDEHLDDDDTLAQFVLHEICHFLVAGPASRAIPDWGLQNSPADAIDEAAALRLQAHLLGAWGLRGVLFPTAVIREFYEALPDDAFLPPDEESAQRGRIAALRAAEPGMREVLREALAATRALIDPTLHRKSGHPIGVRGRTCGECAMRTPGGLCRQAARAVRVRADEPACTRCEPPLDCLACGACCRSAYDLVPLHPRERLALAHPELLCLDRTLLTIRRNGDRCAALDGAEGGPFGCVIYEDRPRVCRDFARGGRHCLDARRRVGLSF